MKRLFLKILMLSVIWSGMLLMPCFLHAESQELTPLINPSGNMEAYDNLEFFGGGELEYLDIEYENLNGDRVTLRTCGDIWKMTVPFADAENPFRGLIENIQELDGTILGRTGSKLVGSVQGKGNDCWWAVGEYPEEGSYGLTVIREKQLIPGRTLTFRPGEEDSRLQFLVSRQTDLYQVLRIELPEGAVKLSTSVEFSSGDYTRILYYEKELTAEKGVKYYLDDLPQERGRIPWNITWEDDERPAEISLTLEDAAELPVLKEGTGLGALLVRGIQFGEVRVKPADDLTLYHPGLEDDSFYGDLTPEGEVLFWLPPGLWDIVITPRAYFNLEHCTAGLIPVNPGEMTVVNIPEILTEAYSPEPAADRMIRNDALQIVQAREKGQEVEVYFSLIDQEAKEIIPTPDNIEVFEGGRPARLLEVGSVKTPPDVVLLLDSSGSMRGQMEETLAAARKFIASLPDEASIRVVDFDTDPEVLPGQVKAEVLKSLDRVKANGATALYDTILEGLGLLEGKNRPSLLVFTDGVDANFDDSGPGSTATLAEVVEEVREAGIPLFTIGFGPNHDNKVLVELADLSGGNYYPAADPEALAKVFAAINENLGGTYQLSYERPAAAGISDIPVISLVVDTSGSMDISPEEGEGCGYRMQKVKNLLHDFILELPEKSLVQLINFYHTTEMPQIMTPGKAEIFRGLGKLYAEGGTDILGSTDAALRSLLPLPSERKVLIYITDAALDVQNGKEQYLKLLQQIKAQNIR